MESEVVIKGSYYGNKLEIYAAVTLKQELDTEAIKEINEDIKQFVSHLEKRYANKKVK